MKTIILSILAALTTTVSYGQKFYFPFNTNELSRIHDYPAAFIDEDSTAEQILGIEFIDKLTFKDEFIDSIITYYKHGNRDWRFDHSAAILSNNGLIESIVVESYNDEHQTDTLRHDIKLGYDDKNKLISAERYVSSRGYGDTIEMTEYTYQYDKDRNISTSTWEVYDNYYHMNPKEFIFTYDSLDFSLFHRITGFYESNWLIDIENTYSRSDSSLQFHKLRYNEYNEISSNEKVNYLIENLSNNKCTILKSIIYSYGDDKPRTTFSKKEISITGDTLINIVNYFKNESDWQHVSNEEYRFNKSGDILEKKRSNYDYFPCDIHIGGDNVLGYTRNEIDPDTIIVTIDTDITKYAYYTDSVVVHNFRDGRSHCAYCFSQTLTTYYFASVNSNNENPTSIAFNTTTGNLKNELIVYPNPSNGIIRIKTNSKLSSDDTYQIIDFNGKILKQGKHESETIDVSELSQGVYLLYLQSSIGRFSQKLVIN